MARKKSKRRQMRLIIFGLPSLFIIIYFCFSLFSYIYSYSSLKNEESRLNNELLSLQEEKHNLKVEIQKLNDPNYVIRYAKEKFLYSVNGEYVLKLNDDKKIEYVEVKKENNSSVIIGGIILFCLIILIFGRKKSNA